MLHHLGASAESVRQPAAVRKLLAGDDKTIEALRAQAPRVERSAPELAGVFERLLEEVPTVVVGSSRLAGALFDALNSGLSGSDLLDTTLERLPSSPALGGGSALTASGLSRLMVATGDPHPGEHVLDLASGEGGLLLHAAEQAGGPVELTGYEADPVSWAIAKSRFYLRGLAVDLRLEKSLDGNGSLPTADLVLIDPPLEGRRTYHLWLSLAAGCVGSAGRAVVALPAISLDTSRKEWREVGGQVAVVVRATSRLRVDHGDALALWVLDARPGPEVLMIDASRLGRHRGLLNDVGVDEAELLRNAVRAWRSDAPVDEGMQLSVGTVPRVELKQPDAELFPRGKFKSRRSEWSVSASEPAHEDLVEAQKLVERLADLVNGPLASYTSEEHRRAVKRLMIRLDSYLDSEDEETDESLE